MTQRRVELDREAEGDARLLGDPHHLPRMQVQVDAELLQHVGGAAGGGRGAVAVLDDLRPRAGHHDRGHGGDVDGLGAVAAGADDVDAGAGHLDEVGVRVHRPYQPGDLGDGLALGAQRDGEARDLGVGGLAAHDAVHGPGGVVGAEVAVVEERVEDARPGAGRRAVAACRGHNVHGPRSWWSSGSAGPPYRDVRTAKSPVHALDGALAVAISG